MKTPEMNDFDRLNDLLDNIIHRPTPTADEIWKNTSLKVRVKARLRDYWKILKRMFKGKNDENA